VFLPIFVKHFSRIFDKKYLLQNLSTTLFYAKALILSTESQKNLENLLKCAIVNEL